MSLILLPTIRASRKRFLPETFAFAAASGATDLQPLDNLFRYVIGAGLWSNFRIYPQKSAQNAGSGSTVFGAGALTSNNGTLIGSPTWGAGGISYNGSNQCARISDFLSAATLTVWTRLAQGNTGLTGAQVYFSQLDTGGNNRSVVFQQRNAVGGNITLLQRNSTGVASAADFENYDTASNVSSTADRSYVVQWVDGGGRGLWINNTAESISRTGGTDQTARLNTSVDVLLAALLVSGSPSTFLQATYIAAAFLEGPEPTTTQRETITNLINAL
jgi:hypothetical protein